MYYRKRKYGKKYKSKPHYQKKKALKSLAKKLQDYVHEKKFKAADLGHQSFAALGIDWVSPQYQLTNITQGSTDTSRDGDRLSLRSIELDFIVYYDLVVLNPPVQNESIRILVFQWFPSSPIIGGTNPSPSTNEMLTSVALTSTRAHIVPYSHDNRQLFRILYDKVITLSVSGTQIVHVKKMITKFAKRELQYLAGTTVGTNQVYMALATMHGTAYTFFDGVAKVNFNDL